MAFDELQHVRGFETANELLAELMQAYPPQTLAASLRLQKLACDLWRAARATQLEVATTEKPNAFCNEWLSRLVTYANAVHKGAENSLLMLEKLDEQARESQPPETVEKGDSSVAPGEGTAALEVRARKPVANSIVTSSSDQSVA